MHSTFESEVISMPELDKDCGISEIDLTKLKCFRSMVKYTWALGCALLALAFRKHIFLYVSTFFNYTFDATLIDFLDSNLIIICTFTLALYMLAMLREITVGSQGSWMYFFSWCFISAYIIWHLFIVSLPNELQMKYLEGLAHSEFYTKLMNDPGGAGLPTLLGFAIVSNIPYFILFWGARSLVRTSQRNNVKIGLLGPKLT